MPNGAGAAASKGQHKSFFPPNLLGGQIELNTPDGKWLRSQVLGLAFFDSASGKSVLISEIKSSRGEVHQPNVVMYPDAFTDGVSASVRYKYTLAGFEQDIILQSALPVTPEDYGLNPATTKIQVLTEFLNPPQPVKEKMELRDFDGADLSDETLHFGRSMTMGRGKAFSLGQTGREIFVQKQWLKLEGRDFLIEEVSMPDLKEQLELLPTPEEASLKSESGKLHRTASIKRELPIRKLAKAEKSTMKLAQASMPSTGLVLDYNTLNTTLTNYTFQGDTTYYISGTVVSCRTNTFAAILTVTRCRSQWSE